MGRQVIATHFDPNENLLCCLSGKKRFWLYPPCDAAFLYPSPASDGSRASAPPFQLHDELPPPVRGAFADVARTRGPVEVRLEAGDAFYLRKLRRGFELNASPFASRTLLPHVASPLPTAVGWWHCVEGSVERNMILNFWMKVHPQKRELSAEP